MQAERTGAARPGERIGPYTILTELASGGMGRVYLARSPGGRTLAVKTLLAQPGDGAVPEADRRRFAREVSLARRVRGLYTASVVDADAEARVPWMATEYIPAPSLRELVTSQGPLPSPALHWIAAGMTEALVSIHTAGLVHRDVKPSNVLLPEDGPRLIDFGISQAADITRTATALGTIAFAAPEQARGEPTTPASDVFSLGATLHYLATGRSPYRDMGEGSALEQLVRAAEGDLDLTGLATDVHDLILPCLALDAARRPSPQVLLIEVGTFLAKRPQARGAADWLPRAWSTAIEGHRRRRTDEADAARRRVDPDAATRRTPPTAPPRTRRMPRPAPRPAPRRAPRRRALGIGIAVAVLAGGGVLYAMQGDGAAPGTVVQDMRLALVEQSQTGECADTLPPPTFYAPELETCFSVSTRAADRMSVTRFQEVRAVFETNSGGWVVQATFQDGEDTERFTELTRRASQRENPRNQLAILLGDRLISAPAVTGPLTGGEMQISAEYTQDEANELARQLGAP
ncbi:protein kinase [Streptomyces sp. NPDC048290]|uniref:serine/threonine-protein kinase n=1 Tax=Streptomyces sp. NPDC048290 TaxID=3155811 RepID=UPI00341812C2